MTKIGTMLRRLLKLIDITAALLPSLYSSQYLPFGGSLAFFGPKLTSHRQYPPIYIHEIKNIQYI